MADCAAGRRWQCPPWSRSFSNSLMSTTTGVRPTSSRNRAVAGADPAISTRSPPGRNDVAAGGGVIRAAGLLVNPGLEEVWLTDDATG